MDEDPLDSEIVGQIRKLGGDELLSDLVEIYLEHTPKRLEVLDSGLREGDLERVEKAAHSIRSSSVSLGARAIAEQAAAVERLAQEGEEAKLGATVGEFEQSVVALMGYLRTEISGSVR